MRRSFPPALCALALFALSSCDKPNEQPAMGPPAVSVAQPIQREVADWDEFTGRFEAPAQVEVRARAGGYLDAVHFREGEMVRKGQLLFTLDARPAEAQLAAARAQAELARAELSRAEALLAAQAISREEFESRQSAARVAEAALKARELDVEFTRVVAPISGLVSQRRVDPGNLIAGGTSAGDVLATIVAVDPIHFTFDASEAQFLKYQRQAKGRSGAPVDIRLQDEPEARWNGTVDYFDNALDPASGTARLRAVVRNPGGFVKPGMFGRARMMGSGTYQALLIPETAIVPDGPRRTAYVLTSEGEIAARVLELGPQTGALRVVKAGLQPTDQVVVNGVQRVRPGARAQGQRVTLGEDGKIAPQAAAPAPAQPGK